MRFGFILLFVFGSLSVAHCGENWPQFRGPDGNGVSDATGLPLTFSDTENVRWKTPIHGKGWSSPVVWGDQVWLTTATEDGKEMFAICVDLASGKILHDIKLWDVAEPQPGIDYNSYASPSPVIEQGRVYVHFGAHGTAAIDTATGEILWKRQDLPCNHFRGAGSSPILVDNLVVLTFDGYDYNYLAALDKRSGEIVWKRDRNITSYDRADNGDYHKAFSTPQVIDAGGRKQLVSPSAGATIAYDPATGAELWRVRSGGMNAAARPIFGNGLIYCTTADGGWQLFALKPGGSGDVSESHLAWKFNKNVSKRPSPLLVGDLLFMVSDHSGIVTCVDAKEGKLIWQHRLGGDYCASPIYADGRIYLFEVDGNAPVIGAGREFRLLAENHLEAGSMASPAVVGRSLIVRTKTHLYRFEQLN
jgi:outer membrane protein assembly factor BamB